jgi:ABC-type multidrug transport system ATPase subunit
MNPQMIEFENVVCVSKDGKRILEAGVSARILRGQMLTIIGPSGCGKSTLLNVLGTKNKPTSGDVFYYSSPCSISYVEQDVCFLGDFTVYETLVYRYRLLIGGSVDADVLNGLLKKFALFECKDTRVGSIIHKGISGGQKRRLAICLEFIQTPNILLLDEPTSGLDYSSALEVYKSLVYLSTNEGLTILTSIHQPSSYIWELCQHIMLMSQGRMVFCGQRDEMVRYFDRTFHLSPPLHTNPFEFYLGIVSSDFDTRLPHCDHAYTLDELCYQPPIQESNSRVHEGRSQPSVRAYMHAHWWSRLFILLSRNLYNHQRNYGLFLFRLILFICIATVFGIVFLNVTSLPEPASTIATMSALSITPTFSFFLSITLVPFLIEDKRVLQMELRNHLYSVLELVASLFITVILVTMVLSLLSAGITILLCQFKGVSFLDYWLNLWGLLVYSETFILCVTAAIHHPIICIAIACLWYGICLVTIGFFVPFHQMNWAVRWIMYINPQQYIFVSGLLHEFRTNGTLVWKEYDVMKNNGVFNSYWINLGIVWIFISVLLVILTGIIWLKWNRP